MVIRRRGSHDRPGRLLRLLLEPKSLTREKTLSLLGFSQLPLVLFGLLTQRQALFFSRSLACLFCRMRELAIAAAMASLAARLGDTRPKKRDSQSPLSDPRGICPGGAEWFGGPRRCSGRAG